MNFIKKYKYNYLLITAVIGYCAYLLIYFGWFSLNEISEAPNRFNPNLGFLPLVFSALIFAPVIEELAFRGFYTKNRILQIISIIGIPLLLLLIKNYFVLIIAIPYLILLIINLYKKNYSNKHILFVYSAVVFALAHYKLEHFNNIITVIPIIGQFAVGLLLLWVVLNFNIKKSILLHFVFNLLLMLPAFISLQYPNKEVKTLEYNNYQLTWEKTPVLSGMRIFSKPNPYAVSVTNFTPLDVYLSYDRDNKPKLRNSELFNKYKLSIKKTNEDTIKLDSIIVKDILIKAELLIDN